MIRLSTIAATVLCFVVPLAFDQPEPADKATSAGQHTKNGPTNSGYFPPPESKGGWRKLDKPENIRRLAGMDPNKLAELRDWLLKSDRRDFAAVVICNGYIVLEVEHGNSSKTDSRRVASVSKAICAAILAIASEESRHGRTPKKMTFDDPAFDFIPWAKPLSDPRKAKITVKQLLNHTSGICPEATGARNQGPWEHVLGHDGDPLTAKLAFNPGTRCGYSTFALYHAALVSSPASHTTSSPLTLCSSRSVASVGGLSILMVAARMEIKNTADTRRIRWGCRPATWRESPIA
jgi:CubicO group peptidase (beta-lactamase class C family)